MARYMSDPVRCPACDHLFHREEAPPPVVSLHEEEAAEIASSGSTYLSGRTRRGRTSPLAKTARWLSVIMLLGAIVAVIYQAAATGTRPPQPRTLQLDPLEQTREPAIGDPHAPAVKPHLPAEMAQPASPTVEAPQSIDLPSIIRHSVVILETEDADGTASLGTGFLLPGASLGQQAPLVVTNYHVLSSATSAYARFHDGTRHAVNGYRAIARELDLAAIELASLPVDSRPMTLATETPRLRAEVVSVGHPQGIEFSIYPGEVSQRLQTTALPASARNYLRGSIRGERNLHWLQHTARISEGNSGGPLLNAQGEVVGVNTWTNHEVGFSYALDERHIRSLLADPLAEVAPLKQYTSRQALAAESREQLTPQRLKTLLAEVEAFGFLPSSRQQYRTWQELALAMTYAGKQAKIADNSIRQQQQEELSMAADQVASRLRDQPWNTIGATTIVNEFAMEEYRRPSAGVVLFAVVERIVSGTEGSRGMLAHLAGSEQQIFIPLDGMLIQPANNSQCLIVGMNFQGQVVRYGDNPLDLKEVPVIVTASDGIMELKQ